ncbi:MAG: tRNA (N(6)-L-threonylcarbamoyladenosine(37)-C(2))-methylthiotransferase MtaB [Sedimentisphaerales bacterium]|nr:tRNA (N(6)-L-threonylcarbamoyladenosine(37)-C(2))-methylthiotransferase MtaB [Sedimentisphaerales bacterium]
MKAFSIYTLGCKVNQYESQQIRELLESYGLKLVDLAESPGLVVLNSCCVTHIASAKSRQLIRKILKYNPNATIVVTGCLPIGQATELGDIKETKNMHLVNQKEHLESVLEKAVFSYQNSKTPKTHKIKHKTEISAIKAINQAKSAADSEDSSKAKRAKPKMELLKKYAGQTRAFLKVQDGCDGHCTYCIVPKIRNKIISKSISDVLEEAYNLIYAGHKEIVLTGIFLGAYGQKTVRRKKQDAAKKDKLAELLGKLAQIQDLERIRLSSLEPADVTEKLLDVFCQNPKIMPHMHLPLQSGSDRILKRMCRQYSVADFLEVVDQIKDRLVKPAITTDIIVGFPGESDDDFQKTFEIAKKVGFSKIHVFSYSSRKNTAAAKMDGHIKPEIIKKRSKQLSGLDWRLQSKFRKQFIGEKVKIIVEGTDPVKGRCERYFMVECPQLNGDKINRGDLIEVQVDK